MKGPLVICSSCNRHIRRGERSCPHCDAPLAGEGAFRLLHRDRVEIRRVMLAVAVAGLGLNAGCDDQDPLVVGTCTDSYHCGFGCQCGRAGKCQNNGKCVACGHTCDAGEFCNADGTCVSPAPCYGSPPLLA